MPIPLRVLIVEDSEDDAVLLLRELRKGGYDPLAERVETAAEMAAQLGARTWDVVISDYSMPSFEAPAALAVLKDRGLDIPFLIVSRHVGEDLAVAAMKAGASDYIMKDNLARLVPAIERERREAREREKRRRSEAALRESEERYALAARGANDGLWDWDLRSGSVYFSPRWKLMLGFGEDEMASGIEEWLGRVHRDDVLALKSDLDAHVKALTPHFENEHRVLHRDDSYRWMLSRGLAVRDESGSAYRIAGSMTDITERKVAEEQLLHDAFHDALTDLANRALFLDRLGLALSRSRRRHLVFAVLFVDLDRFKIVNDSLGHLAGDQLLIAIARRLEECMRPGDTLARFGGDEFAVLLDDIPGPQAALAVAERIHAELGKPFPVKGEEIVTSASIGIALSAPHYEQPEDLLRDADTAMYRAKAHGKARHEVFDTEMHARAVALLKMEADLRRAIERGELLLHYQPIVSLADGELCGLEALVRWQHPERGLLYPAEFIHIAEETRLILALGRWVLREACRQLRSWQDLYGPDAPFTMSVNLSPQQFAEEGFAAEVREIVAETGADPLRLKLEITESLMMDTLNGGAARLAELKNEGIQLYVDDFGTGYSSLGYLHSLPIDCIKIDQSFVARLGMKEESLELVRAIVTLARNLGMEVIAEGVETAEQLARLASLECQYGQGFLFSKPVSASDFEMQMASRPWLEHFDRRPGAMQDASGNAAA